MFWPLVTFLTIIGCCGVALRWGGRDERIAAVGFLLAVVATNVTTDGAYTHTETGVLVVDVITFFGLLALALRSDRFWPMYAAAFQLVGTTIHFASLSQTGDFSWAYYIALIFWTFPVFIALAAGTWLEGRYRRG